jgi:hypothetical protein
VKFKWLIPLALIVIMVLAACSSPAPQADVATPTPVAAATEELPQEAEATPTPMATPEPMPTPEATPVEAAAETPTPAPEEEAAAAEPAVELMPCPEELTGQDALVAQQIPAVGCPEGAAERVYMARQPFQQGQMIWREDLQIIYVLTNDGSWLSFDDEFEEGQPENDPALTPPQNLLQPVRGFGKLWREDLGGSAAAIGWATAPEAGVNATVQEWDNGVLITFDLANRFLLLDDGRWERIQ